jgi:hypothetical protein
LGVFWGFLGFIYILARVVQVFSVSRIL